MFKLVKSKNGLFLINDNDSIISKELMVNGVWENYMLEFAKKHIKPNSTVIDVGSNIGTMCIPFSKFAEGVVVHAFEPSRVLYNQLCGNLFLNNCLNVESHNVALSSKEQVLFFDEIDITKKSNYGDNRLFGGNTEVRSIKMDSLFFEKKVSFIKIDCQGYDFDILLGSKKTLLENNNPTVVVEWEDYMAANLNHSFQDLTSFMRSLGYDEILNLHHNDWIFSKKLDNV